MHIYVNFCSERIQSKIHKIVCQITLLIYGDTERLAEDCSWKTFFKTLGVIYVRLMHFSAYFSRLTDCFPKSFHCRNFFLIRVIRNCLLQHWVKWWWLFAKSMEVANFCNWNIYIKLNKNNFFFCFWCVCSMKHTGGITLIYKNSC